MNSCFEMNTEELFFLKNLREAVLKRGFKTKMDFVVPKWLVKRNLEPKHFVAL